MKKISIFKILVFIIMVGLAAFSSIQYVILKEDFNNSQESNQELNLEVNNLKDKLDLSIESSNFKKSSEKCLITNDELKQIDEYYDVLNNISCLEFGTAGSSLKQAIVAVNLLNWVESNTFSDEEINIITKYYFNFDKSAVNLNIYEPFGTNFDTVCSTSENIINKNNIDGLLNDCGNPQKYDSYSMDKFNKCKDIINSNKNN